MDKTLILGRISGVFGVRGWVKIYSYTEPREAILEYKGCQLNIKGQWTDVQWLDGKRHGKTVIARVEGIDDRDEAQLLVGADIRIDRESLPDAEEGQYYWADLEGLQVVTANGQELGRVDHLMATGANDVLVVKGDKETLIPFVLDDYVLDVDTDAGVIRVNWDWPDDD